MGNNYLLDVGHIFDHPTFIQHAPLFGVLTDEQALMFTATMIAEVGLYPKRLTESFAYSYPRFLTVFGVRKARKARKALRDRDYRAIANIVYNGRLGNNNKNDGWKYRGRSIIQLTGKANYQKIQDEIEERLGLVIPIVDHPDLATIPKNGIIIALAYWSLNSIHECKNMDCVTDKVNRYTHSRGYRQRLYIKLLRKFGYNH